MTTFKPGMRVITANGPWPHPRMAGHYGKVIEVVQPPIGPEIIKVDIYGHVDGGPPTLHLIENQPIEEPCLFFPPELEVID